MTTIPDQDIAKYLQDDWVWITQKVLC